MSLIALPAFLVRRREDTSMSETTTDANNDVVMRFLTQGGAVVELRESYRTTFWVESNPTGREVIYPFRCLGCDYEFDNYSSIVSARDEANGHAERCRAMPKPDGEA